MNEGAPISRLSDVRVLQAFRDITTSTNERTFIADNLPPGPVGNNAPVLSYPDFRSVVYALVLGNINSLPFDWAARLSVGGVHMSFFILKQLPVLPAEAYLEEARSGDAYVELVVPRVLKLTYTSHELGGFASDLGYPEARPFLWNDLRRHRLQSELDAIFSHMYWLDRTDLEWILDAPAPSSSFPSLKQHEMREFGEYRTQRYVLEAFDQLERGEIPDLTIQTPAV